ncbi:hypothetical protein E6W36_01385 [Hankyongella ginsenosidimutans]|uniref:Uncharacterized protein n=1 Tax=Hankyongella ginsenosidimutans TaxID=1763828 RepID=A0A4D7C5C5_9SPHN|nr:isocitrate lyase/phosphoenolpyruvate mutase family protein [Hankyongella ginsenosidimutans]QCI78775.1 hypothetical protein E6W36_01385 [Hankyongella ginsenosidimutans]
MASLSAARRGAGADLFINARTDVFLQNPPVWTLKSLGVARISQAPGPYQAAMAALTELARTFLIEEDA